LAAPYNTLLLDVVTWDFLLDLAGNIAMAGPPYSLAQDAASHLRLFISELWYDTTQGVPYWESILGRWPPVSLVKALLVQQATLVPGVVNAVVYLTDFDIHKRHLSGQVQVFDGNGNMTIASF
jgi:hypothetical protein